MPALVALSVVIAHWLYPSLSNDPTQRGELFYVLRGVGGTIVYILLFAYTRNDSSLSRLSRRLAALICLEGAFEESQTAVCGIGNYQFPIVGAGLCVSRFGVLPYAALCATAILYLWKRHALNQRSKRSG